MLCLREEVDRDTARVIGVVRQDHDFRWPGDRIDADMTKDLALGLRDIGIAGTDDPVDRWDTGGAVGQRGNGLRAADTINL